MCLLSISSMFSLGLKLWAYFGLSILVLKFDLLVVDASYKRNYPALCDLLNNINIIIFISFLISIHEMSKVLI